MEVGDSVRLEARRFRAPRFENVNGHSGRVAELREVEGRREAPLEVRDLFVKGWRGRIPVGYLYGTI